MKWFISVYIFSIPSQTDTMNRRESFGSTFTRRGSSSTNPKVIVPRKRIIVARTMSDGSSYSKVSNISSTTSQQQMISLQLVAESTTSNMLTCPPTCPPSTPVSSVVSDNIYFPPPDFYAIQNKRYS